MRWYLYACFCVDGKDILLRFIALNSLVDLVLIHQLTPSEMLVITHGVLWTGADRAMKERYQGEGLRKCYV